jgi:hypothetical protein
MTTRGQRRQHSPFIYNPTPTSAERRANKASAERICAMIDECAAFLEEECVLIEPPTLVFLTVRDTFIRRAQRDAQDAKDQPLL